MVIKPITHLIDGDGLTGLTELAGQVFSGIGGMQLRGVREMAEVTKPERELPGSPELSESEPEQPGMVPFAFQHETLKGVRLPGWETLRVRTLAEHLGVGPQHLNQIMCGRTTASAKLLRRIAAALEITLDELLTRVDKAKELDVSRKTKKRIGR